MTASDHSERRDVPRRAENWRVLFGPTGQLVAGFLADLSPMGVSIVTENLLPVGAEIEVHFGVDDDQRAGRLQMRGIVRHHTAGRLGVQFVNVEPAQREHWWQIIRGVR